MAIGAVGHYVTVPRHSGASSGFHEYVILKWFFWFDIYQVSSWQGSPLFPPFPPVSQCQAQVHFHDAFNTWPISSSSSVHGCSFPEVAASLSRRQTYHAASVDTLLFSQSPQPTQAPWHNHRPSHCEGLGGGQLWLGWEFRGAVLIAFEWHLVRFLLSQQEEALSINLLVRRRFNRYSMRITLSHVYLQVTRDRRGVKILHDASRKQSYDTNDEPKRV